MTSMTRGYVRAGLAGLALAVAGLVAPAVAQTPADAVARFTTLDWPPFAGQNLPGGGAVVEILREALAPAGIRVEVEVLPWKRAVDRARRDPGVDGFLPIYLDDVVDGFFPSAELLASPLGLAQRGGAGIAWTTLDDLSGLRIGTVLGYTNTPAFDAAVRDRRLTTDEAPDDLTNLLKVAGGRLRVAVVDCTVLRFMLDHEPRLAAVRDVLACNPRPLASKGIFVAWRDSAHGHALDSVLRAGLARVDPQAILARYQQVTASPPVLAGPGPGQSLALAAKQ